MPMITIRRKKNIFAGLLIGLMLFSVLSAGWTCAGAQDAVQTVNSSGNINTALSVDPTRKNTGYSSVLYDSRNGLPSSEANAIAQTSEGFIWIGSYAGLTRYDGYTFELLDHSTGILNVRCLYVDSQDRLWVGTNDSGLFLIEMDHIYHMDLGGLPGFVSIRAVTEDADGNIYIGGMGGAAIFNDKRGFVFIEDERLDSLTVKELRLSGDGLVWGLSTLGDLFSLKDGRVLSFLSHTECRVKGVLSILPDPMRPGYLYLGTEDNMLWHGSPERNFPVLRMKDTSPLSYTECLEAINGQIWICAGNGIGMLDGEGVSVLNNMPMNNSVKHVMTDYEGNLWFTSTRQGIMKIVPNRFSDLYELYDLAPVVVNATCIHHYRLFVGTDNGLTVIVNNEKLSALPLDSAVTASGKELDVRDLLEYLEGVRIRSVIADSRDRLWISTWNKHGLICYDGSAITVFAAEDGLLSNQVRTVCECEDGSLLVAHTGGVAVIRDDRVEASYGTEDGIGVAEVLTVAEGYGREIIVGSEGGGICVISSDGIRHIGREDGLSSEVVMRIKRTDDGDGYWIVTGNSLAFMTRDFRVATLTEFPYPDNYDLYENGNGEAWVISSSGIFSVSARELKENGPMDVQFYSIAGGLPYIATSNSYSHLTIDGDLYIAGSRGVIRVNIVTGSETIGTLKAAVPYLEADGERVYPDASGTFTLGRRVRKLTIFPYVFNYLLIEPQVSFRLDGFDTKYTTVGCGDLVPVDYTNLPNGSYRFVMQIHDPSGNGDREVAFRIDVGLETAIGASGSLIMDITSFFFMVGILIYTELYRKRGRLDDRLFFAMIVVNMIMAFADGITYMLHGTVYPWARDVMIAGNMVFYTAFSVFPWIFFLYLDYSVYKDSARVDRMRLFTAIPWILMVILLLINLKTRWIFYFTADNIYRSGTLNELTFIPMAIYFLFSLIWVRKIDPRLVFLGILLAAVRILLGIWIRDISSSAFIYTLLLVCTHIHVMNRPLDKEAP